MALILNHYLHMYIYLSSLIRSVLTGQSLYYFWWFQNDEQICKRPSSILSKLAVIAIAKLQRLNNLMDIGGPHLLSKPDQ